MSDYQAVEAIRRIADLDEPAREVAIEDYSRAMRTTYRILARQFCIQRKLNPARHVEDLTQIIATKDYELVLEAIDKPDSLDGVRNWVGLLKAKCRNLVDKFADTPSGAAQLTGMTPLARRRRELAKTRHTMALGGVTDASDEEVVRATNERLRERYKDPAQSSMICSVSDFYLTIQPLEVVGEPSDPTGLSTLLDSTEGAVVVAEAIEQATAESEKYGVVLDSYFGGLFSDGGTGRIPTNSEVAKMTGLRTRECLAFKARGIDLMRAILDDRFGVSDADWHDELATALDAGSAVEAITAAIERARDSSEEFGTVLAIYFSDVLRRGRRGRILDHTDVASRSGVPEGECLEYKTKGIALMRDVIAGEVANPRTGTDG